MAPACCPIVSAANPTLLPKAIKNAAEIANERTAHLRDRAALTQWIFWLKATVAALLSQSVLPQKSWKPCVPAAPGLEPSFDPIVAYGSPRGYRPLLGYGRERHPFGAPGALLSDTGGHYLEGTTDVTRTIALGPVSADMKRHYTLVLRSHLHTCSTLSSCTAAVAVP